jgi:hypothetical protein
MEFQPPTNQDPVPYTILPTASVPNNQNKPNEITQSRSAIITAIIINLLVDLFGIILILFTNNSGTSIYQSPTFFIASMIIDIILTVNMLRGKQWARTWYLVRCVGGILIFGGISLLQTDFGTLIINTGVLASLIILLTGKSNWLRTGGSIGLTLVSIIMGLILSLFGASSSVTETPEITIIPQDYKTYTSEGFFSISYPPNWSPDMSVIQNLEKTVKNYLSTEGIDNQENKIQIVFNGGDFSDYENLAGVIVNIEPSQIWPLEVMVENTHQWLKENTKQYIEFSRVKTTISNTEAIIQSYQGEDSEGNLTGYKIGYVKGDRFLWTIACVCRSEQLNKNLDTFEQVIRSLRVEF